jgi:hypothetical protein
VWLRACRLTYLVCQAQAPYCLCPPWLRYVFRRYLIDGTILGKKPLIIKCFFFFKFSLQLLFETFLVQKEISETLSRTRKSLHVKPQLFLSDFNETLIFSIYFQQKFSNIKFYQNSSSGCRVVSCGQSNRQTDGRTGMTKLIVVFRNFTKAPKNYKNNFAITPDIETPSSSTHKPDA